MLPSVTSPAALSAPPNALSLAKALQRRWRAATTTAVVFASLVALGAWLFMPAPKVTARTLLQVPPGNVFLFPTKEAIPSLSDHQKTQIALVKSRLVLNAALKEPGIAELPAILSRSNPIEWLEKEVNADFSFAPQVLKISLSGEDGAELTKIVNAIREGYRKEVLDKEHTDRVGRLKKLGEYKLDYETRLQTMRRDEQRLSKDAGARDSNARTNILTLLGQQLNWVDRECFTIQSDLNRARAELNIRKAMDTYGKPGAKPAVPPSILEDMFSKDPVVVKRRADIRQIDDTIVATLARAVQKERDPTVIVLRKQRREAEDALNAQRKVLYPKYEDEIRQKTNFDLTQTTGQLQARVTLLEKEHEYLTTERKRLQEEYESKKDSSQKLEVVYDGTKQLEDMTKRLQAEHAALELEINAPSRVKLVEEGVVLRPSQAKQVAMTFGGAIFAAIGMVALAFALFEFRARRVSNMEEISQGLGMTIVGSIPDCKTGRKGVDTNQILVEAVEAIRTMLLRADQTEPMRVLMVTSASNGEGKTSLATHLAASLAEVGRRTLLIDGDLRNPIAHRLFGLDLSPGFCDVLRDDIDVDAAVQTTRVAGLSMVTAGMWDSQVSRQLAQDGFVALLGRLRQEYEFVVIDCSPVLPVVDPLLIGQHVDGAILSTLRDVSRMPSVYAAHQRLTAGGVRVLGAVVNGVRGEQYGAYPYRSTQATESATAGTQTETNV